MFIQIIQGKCTRQDELRAMAERWRTSSGRAPTAGSAGPTASPTTTCSSGVVRFESREAAMANSARPEQGAWAEQMMALMDGPVEFHDCDDVTLMMGGGSDDGRLRPGDPRQGRRAGAAQGADDRHRDAARDAARRSSGRHWRSRPTARSPRPSPSRARRAPAQGEQKEMPDMPAEVRETLETAMKGAQFYDLHHPWFESR